MITRRKFLTLGSLGIASLVFPSFLFSNSTHLPIIVTDVNTLLQNAKILRKQGKKNQAKQIYQQIITQYPAEVRAYDGMRKILLSQKKKEWEVILMFKAAVLLNPTSDIFKQRLYKEYSSASLGNKKIKKAINFNGRLLQDVKQKYEVFVQNNPNNKNLQNQFSKIKRLLDCNADTQNAKNNTSLKVFRKAQRKKFKTRFDLESNQNLEARLTTLSSKPDSPDRKQHIRELHSLLVKRYRKEKNNSLAFNKALTYYNDIDKSDPLFLKHIRDLAKLQGNHDALIAVENQNHLLKSTFWSGIALLDSYIRKSEKQNTPLSSQITQIISALEPKTDDPDKKFELIIRKIKIDLLKNDTDAAKEKILLVSKTMFGSANAHTIDRVNVLIAKYYKKKGDPESKNKLLNAVSNPTSYFENSDPVIKSAALMNQNRNFQKPIHIQNLQRLISKL